MKSLAVLTAAAIAAAAPLRADLVIVQKTEANGLPADGIDTTIKIKGDKVRLDATPHLSTLADTRSGAITALMHQQKMAMTIPTGAVNAMRSGPGASHDKAEPSTDLKATGRTETINGFKCAEYRGKLAGMDATVWTTKDVASYEKIIDQMSKAASGSNDPVHSALGSTEKLPGFPVRTTIKAPQGEVTSTLVSLKESPVPDAAFEVPADYRKVEMPNLLRGATP